MRETVFVLLEDMAMYYCNLLSSLNKAHQAFQARQTRSPLTWQPESVDGDLEDLRPRVFILSCRVVTKKRVIYDLMDFAGFPVGEMRLEQTNGTTELIFKNVAPGSEHYYSQIKEWLDAFVAEEQRVEVPVTAQRLGSATPLTERESDHYAYSKERRFQIVREYRAARSRHEVQGKEAWAKSKHGISGRTLREYEREYDLSFPENREQA
jgi:hypothetical protein